MNGYRVFKARMFFLIGMAFLDFPHYHAQYSVISENKLFLKFQCFFNRTEIAKTTKTF